MYIGYACQLLKRDSVSLHLPLGGKRSGTDRGIPTMRKGLLVGGGGQNGPYVTDLFYDVYTSIAFYLYIGRGRSKLWNSL